MSSPGNRRVYTGDTFVMSDRLTASRETAALLARFRGQRCPEAFRVLVESYSGLVQGVAERILEDRESARDVAQAVFADLARLASGLSPDTALGGWLHRHAVFLALRQRTSNRRRGLREEEAHRRWTLEQGEDAAPPPWRAELDEALSCLAPPDRRALVLRYLENLPLRAVAAGLGVGEDAAQKRVERAVEKLRLRLVRRGFASLSAAGLTASLAAIPQPAAAGGTASLAASALKAAAASATPSAGTVTTFFAMNLKAILAGGAVAAALTGAVLTPIILSQQDRIAALEEKLRPPPGPPPPVPASGAAKTPAPAVAAAPRINARRSEYEAMQARLAPLETRIKSWTDSIMQVDDAARKQKALDEMRAAMESSGADDVLAAVTTWQRVGSVEFDRGIFRPAVQQLLSSADAVLRRSALQMLPVLPPDDGDIARVTALAGDTDAGVRRGVVSGLFWLTKGDLTGEAGRTVLQVLTNEAEPSRSLIDVMWGAKFPPELEHKLVEFARAPAREGDEQLAYYAVYSCLSTQNNKGPECVDLLIERLLDPDSYNVGGRAAWGLAYGVQPGLGLETKIADAAVKVWQNRSDQYLRSQLMKCLTAYGDSRHAAALEQLAAAPAMGEQVRAGLLKTAETLRQRDQPAPPP